MEVKVESDWSIGDLIEYENQKILQVNREYQRGLRWTGIQKCMFIDSIFRGYSIPAFYLHKKQTSAGSITNTYYDIVDGQQRIDAIYSYSEGAFSLLDPSDDSGFRFPNFVKDNPSPWGGKRFSDLPEELRTKLKNHEIVVYEITTKNENSIRDLFIRLQGGTPLTPQDKRDSWPGNFTEFVLKVGGKSGVDKWFGIPLFKEISKVSNESRRRQLVAQVFMLFWTLRNESKFCDIKSVSIDQFYHSQVGFDDKSLEAIRFQNICKKLYDSFSGKPKLVGHYIIHLVLFLDSLIGEYAHGWEPALANKLNEFEQRRHEASDAARNRRETKYGRYYSEYGQLTQTRSDDAATIRRRHAFFVGEMLKFLAPKKLDAKRSFSDLERQTVFFRDMEMCQYCRMNGSDHKVVWEECEIHHITSHSHGGATSIDNAALVHRDCHPKSQADVDKFSDWWSSLGSPDQGARSEGSRSFPPPEGTKAKFEYRGQLHLGEIRDGHLALTGGHEGTYKSFSQASDGITGTSRNGWRDWYLCLPESDAWIVADEWRKRI